GGYRFAEWSLGWTLVITFHPRLAGGGAVRISDRLGLRHSQCEYRAFRSRDRRRLRRREGDRRGTRSGCRFVEGLYAPADEYDQLWLSIAAGAGSEVRNRRVIRDRLPAGFARSAAIALSFRLRLCRRSHRRRRSRC